MLSSSFVGSTRLSSVAARAGGARVAVVAPPVVAPRIGLVVEAAHKKGSGHSKNGRDSVSKVRSWSAVCDAQGNKARNDGDNESKSSGHGGGKQKKKKSGGCVKFRHLLSRNSPPSPPFPNYPTPHSAAASRSTADSR